MLPRRVLFGGLLFVATMLTGVGQTSGSPFEALKHAIGLSDSQVLQLQQESPAAARSRTRTMDSPSASAFRQRIGDAAGARNLPAETVDSLQDSILDDSQRIKLAAIKKVLDHRDAAALALEFGLISRRQWPGGPLCDSYPIGAYAYASDLGLSESQRLQFSQLKREAESAGTTPRHDLALAVLDETQKASLAAFENALLLASEAVELRLISIAVGEILCP